MFLLWAPAVMNLKGFRVRFFLRETNTCFLYMIPLGVPWFLVTFSNRLWEADKLFTLRFNDISIIPRMAKISRQVFRLCKLWNKWSGSTGRGEQWRQRSSRQIESRNETPLLRRPGAADCIYKGFLICIGAIPQKTDTLPLRGYYEIVSLDEDQ